MFFIHDLKWFFKKHFQKIKGHLRKIQLKKNLRSRVDFHDICNNHCCDLALVLSRHDHNWWHHSCLYHVTRWINQEEQRGQAIQNGRAFLTVSILEYYLPFFDGPQSLPKAPSRIPKIKRVQNWETMLRRSCWSSFLALLSNILLLREISYQISEFYKCHCLFLWFEYNKGMGSFFSRQQRCFYAIKIKQSI